MLKKDISEKKEDLIQEEDISATDIVNEENQMKEESNEDITSDDGLLSKKEKEISELKEIMLRRQADFENFKKRMLKNSEQEKKLSIKDIAIDVIEINDNILRASEAAENIDDNQSLEDAHKSYVEGVKMISKNIETMLEKYGIEEIESENVPFDPNIHEAVEITMDEKVKTDSVTHVYQKGFKFEEFVIRSAKVRVTKPLQAVAASNEKKESNASEPDDSEDGNNDN